MGDLIIDNDLLISLVEGRPVLWDKTLVNFKDRNLTRVAWREVCCALINNFEGMEDSEKNAFGKEVIKRWGNLRDAFSRSMKKQKACKNRGAGAPILKKYVYADQMQFLNKLFQARETAESLGRTTDTNVVEDVDSSTEDPLPPTETIRENPRPREHKRRHQPDEVELTALQEPPPPLSPFMSFFQGLLPHLNRFDDDDFLEFQLGVLEVISEIKNKRKLTTQSQLLPPHTCCPNNNPYPQHPSFSQSQVPFSYPSSFQPQQPETYQSLNRQTQKIKNSQDHSNDDPNYQRACSSKWSTAEHYKDFVRTTSPPSPVLPASPSTSDTIYDLS